MQKGRPITFDRTEVLNQIMDVFWAYGYIGTSYKELCAATKLTKPSLYNAFGNKEQTFLSALELYVHRFIIPSVQNVENHDEAYSAIYSALIHMAQELTASKNHSGCLINCNISNLPVAEMTPLIKERLLEAQELLPKAMAKSFLSTKQKRPLDVTQLQEYTLYFQAIIAGLSAMARRGESYENLKTIIDYFIKPLNLMP